MKQVRSESKSLFERAKRTIAGGTVSLNRLVDPKIVFTKGEGARVWDVDGNEYIDYHGAFGPYILGHNDPEVNEEVAKSLKDGSSLFGSGTTEREIEFAELVVEAVPSIEQVQITNSGSEATFHAIRLSRAFTGRDHVVVVQGGYNGWHNDVAYNVMNSLDDLGPRVSPGEYRKLPMSAGIPEAARNLVHVVNYNDLDSVEYCFRRYPVAAMILEPVLQNIGVVPPRPGYLEGLRKLCDEYGVVLVFDEVKTGFRHSLGGYQRIAGVMPDLTTLGKAIANGFPIGVIGGKTEIMSQFADPDPKKRVLIAGTYNAHPVAVAAGIATIKKLKADNERVFHELEEKSKTLCDQLEDVLSKAGRPFVISRLSSAFCVYWMDHIPVDWHDLAGHHDVQFDVAFRMASIENGVYQFPVYAKQNSLSAAHNQKDVDETLSRLEEVISQVK